MCARAVLHDKETQLRFKKQRRQINFPRIICLEKDALGYKLILCCYKLLNYTVLWHYIMF